MKLRVVLRVPLWIIVSGVGFLGGMTYWSYSGQNIESALAVAHAPLMEGYGLVSENRVAEIFQSRISTLSDDKARKLASHVISLCQKHHFDPALVLAVIDVESSFRLDAKSPVGALGLMQLMPGTAQFAARRAGIKYPGVAALSNPFVNTTLGITYLAYLRDKYRSLPPYFHLAAYNLGPARLDQLMTRKSFKPTATRMYYEKIRGRVKDYRNQLITAETTEPEKLEKREKSRV